MKKLYFTWILGLLLTAISQKSTSAEPSLLIIPDLEEPVITNSVEIENPLDKIVEELLSGESSIEGLSPEYLRSRLEHTSPEKLNLFIIDELLLSTEQVLNILDLEGFKALIYILTPAELEALIEKLSYLDIDLLAVISELSFEELDILTAKVPNIIRDINADAQFSHRASGPNELTLQLDPPSQTRAASRGSNELRQPPTILIEMSRDGNTWQTFRVGSDRAHLFNCQRYKKIRVTTQGNNTPAEYDLSCTSRYAVYWNRELQRWDIVTIVRD